MAVSNQQKRGQRNRQDDALPQRGRDRPSRRQPYFGQQTSGYSCKGSRHRLAAVFPEQSGCADVAHQFAGKCLPGGAHPGAAGNRRNHCREHVGQRYYPRSGFVTQTDDYKAAAVTAQRAADMITRPGRSVIRDAEGQRFRWLLAATIR